MTMRLYEVGGAVRDSLLGLPATDRDWVAVGTTPEQMLALGYRPVGRDFPVFLHPVTHEEVALARTERKSGRGYHGFAFQADPSVTLEEDLRRRDLTINAMARDAEGRLIDPWGGERDLRARVLRHVSPAFAEDPVRLLRVARLAARFADFSIAPETMALLRAIVEAGEVDTLVAERVWQEVSRGLMEARPSRMLAVLADCGAWARLMPEIDATPTSVAQRGAWLDDAAGRGPGGETLPVRFALLTSGAGSLATLVERWRVPRESHELATLLAREGAAVLAGASLDAAGLVRLFTRADAWRRAERFDLLLRTLRVQHGAAVPQARLAAALAAATSIDAGAAAAAAAAQGHKGDAIAAAVAAARVAAVQAIDRAVAGPARPCHHPPHAAG